MDAIHLMMPHEQPLDPVFVRVAVDHGVRRLVLLSSRGVEARRDERLPAAERVVKDSGGEWTVPRPDWFNRDFDFRPAIEAGRPPVNFSRRCDPRLAPTMTRPEPTAGP